MFRGLSRAVASVVASLFLGASASAQSLPTVEDNNLVVERLNVGNLELPTGLAFLPKSGGDAFVLEKDTGRVKLIENNKVTKTVLRLNVESTSERGLLGVALHPRFTRNGLVYLYHTNADRNGNATDNRISAFKWNETKKTLTLDRVIKKMPVNPGPNHDGGKIAFGKDGKLYAVIGDLNRRERTGNNEDSGTIGRHTAILRLNPNGSAPKDNPFFNANNTGRRAPLNEIYAYGIRNSFGMNFDPATGYLRDTENGPSDFDEINRITPGMNSGWTDIMGPRSRAGGGKLVSLGGKAKYRDPRFSWEDVIGVTDLAFPMGSLGRDYRDSMFVGDNNTGRLYRFQLNENRTDLDLGVFADDRVADIGESQDSIVFGEDFGVITDMERGPGGLYVLGFDFSGEGALYRIRVDGASALAASALSIRGTAVPEPGVAALVVMGAMALASRRRR